MPIFIKPSATSSGGTSGPAPVNYKNFSQILEAVVPLEPYPDTVGGDREIPLDWQ